jgi:two-component system chemotaxis response regulator CheY
MMERATASDRARREWRFPEGIRRRAGEFRLPQADRDLNGERGAPSPTKRKSEMKQVLVVDDSPVIRKIARRILEGMGLSASEAADGRQALAACSFFMPDAVLVDAAMPVLDGYEFLKELRAMPGGDKPKVVFCTSEYDVAQIARAMHAGADDFLMKPFDREHVQSKFEGLGIG